MAIHRIIAQFAELSLFTEFLITELLTIETRVLLFLSCPCCCKVVIDYAVNSDSRSNKSLEKESLGINFMNDQLDYFL
jgi:hypothetical protein